MAWKWISNNCKQAKFILKLDDDTIPISSNLKTVTFVKYSKILLLIAIKILNMAQAVMNIIDYIIKVIVVDKLI